MVHSLKPEEPGRRNGWFEERRSLFLKNMFKGFSETFCRFRTLYGHYTANRAVSFAEIDHLVGTENRKGRLWDLKDRCHQLWRDADPQADLNGCLLDWLLGSIFHEAMKLKENSYMLQYYAPLAETMKDRHGGSAKFCGVGCQRFMERTISEIEHQMESLGFMFGRANYLLRTMLLAQADNPILLRYLVENPEIPQELWSESLEDLLADMFPQGPEYGFCTAARSYQEGDWYAKAQATYLKALAINPDCHEARHQACRMQALARQEAQLRKGPDNICA
ncbi:hypothetical protein ACUUL3_15785 [Thiovibrio sp. JS02]